MNLAGCKWCLKTYSTKDLAISCCKDKRQYWKNYLFPFFIIIVGILVVAIGVYFK